MNQPLTAAASAVRAAQRLLTSSPSTAPADQIHDALDLAAEQALRAGQIVRRLRDFVARGEVDVQAEDLRGLIKEGATLALAGANGACGVAVGFRLDPALPLVLADRIQIQQVLVNLIRNAVEAMADAAGHKSETAAERREVVVSAAPAGPGAVEVAVADTGPGLAPEVAGRLFDPFVSTKPGGMGMGLAICRTIVEAHGGRLWAEPSHGGAVFRFTLPTAGSDTAPRPRKPRPETSV